MSTDNARLGRASTPTPLAPGAAPAYTQVNATGLPFWQVGAPQCKDKNVRPYPSTSED